MLKKIVISIILFFLTAGLISHSAEISPTKMPIQVEKTHKYVFLRVKTNMPEYRSNPQKQSCQLMKKYFDKDLLKISIIWQKDEFSYGQSFSLAGIYVKQFMNNEISKNKLCSFIKQTDILPSPLSRNNIKKVDSPDVSDKNINLSKQLREKADLYRMNQDYDSARRIYEESILINPADVISYYWIAEIYKKMNNYESAEKYYVKSIEISPDFKAADNALFELRNYQK